LEGPYIFNVPAERSDPLLSDKSMWYVIKKEAVEPPDLVFLVYHNKKLPMSKGTFFIGQPIFSQVLSFIPRQVVNQLAREHKSDYYCKRFTTHEHLVTMLYCVFNHCNSLREVSTGLLAWERRISHLGVNHYPRRSTISDANNRRSEAVFESIYFKLLARYGEFLSDSRPGSKAKRLYIFDSTVITLFHEILKGTGLPNRNGKRKGGIKVHSLLRSDQDVPCMIRFSAATASDTQFLKQVHVPKGSVLLFDKGYPDYTTYNRFTKQGITWITRLRKTATYQVAADQQIAESCARQGVEADAEVVLGSAIKVKARLITYTDPTTRKTFQFLTNSLRLSPLTIADYYKKRWQIELLFKRIKQNYPLRYFLGDSENAIKIQIWSVLIADLLLKVIKKGCGSRLSFSNLASMIRLHLMTYMSLRTFLRSPEKELIKRIKTIIPSNHSPTLFH